MQANLTGSGNYVTQGTIAGGGNATGGGSPGVSYENDPSFTFIPVNDQTNATLLLQQVPGETFYLLYQQGWRVDQLFRLMVDRVELTTRTSTGCDVETIRNVPPPAYTNPPGKPYAGDGDELSQYATFLRISAVLYWLQKHGNLLLRVTYTFVPYDANSALSEPAPNNGVNDPSKGASKTPTAADIIAASNKNAVWEKGKDGSWLLGEKVANPMFYLAPLTSSGTADKADLKADIEQIIADIGKDKEMTGVMTGPALQQVLMDLSNGFSIAGTSTPQNTAGGMCPATPGESQISSRLVMRSLIGLMAAAAQEQGPFDALIHNNPRVPVSTHLKKRFAMLPRKEQEMMTSDSEQPYFQSAVPIIEQIPLLRLSGASRSDEMPPIIQVTYRGKEYRIADLKTENDSENQYWNRDVFRLINELTSQVTVDISKFPLTTLLQ